MNSRQNPFPDDIDRARIWEMLVERDIAAFVDQDWSMVADDFDEQRFLGIHAHNAANPDDWNAAFPSLGTYRDEWLRQAAETAATAYAEPLADGIFRATNLTEIDISGDVALARKKFDGTIRRADGSDDVLNWQTLYFCRKQNDRWRITGFVGYMKYK
ncbi:hypothetical protein N7E70_007700 [Aminobacter sp. NyZ550]|jgi:hypothetical protein|uniref:Cytoplasmic protein n=2 Tax=Aminobacter TaxID=31988 RepID=A0AAC8YLI9_AMIAI|nr:MULTISPECIES: hypothetical protein [Aminobacter]AMS40595.1 Cytoplasmic protein [Aminobacter aminovorans]MBA8905801.1 hypothetical protein [Aminobacter ciceronei]MBA9019580.1 hypothetical protein [Aminobacter ciceronei]MBB3706469.1 hypothetical protein [Aminobacter aminovorans]QOF69908.1 hypothetical protein IG197_18935 [Aminobacter sp. SR38]